MHSQIDEKVAQHFSASVPLLTLVHRLLLSPFERTSKGLLQAFEGPSKGEAFKRPFKGFLNKFERPSKGLSKACVGLLNAFERPSNSVLKAGPYKALMGLIT